MVNTVRTAITTRLDNKAAYGKLKNTRLYEDSIYEKFSDAEIERRYKAVREKMVRLGVDALIITGGPSHWSFGGGMRWLTGHWEWHAVATYVLVPMTGDPTLVYSMGGSHVEAIRRSVFIDDVQPSRGGKFAEVLVDRIKELGLEKSVIGITDIDPRFGDNIPENQYRALKEGLPNAGFQFVGEFFHELITKKSPEELECVRKVGELCDLALKAMIERVEVGVTEYQLAAAAAYAVMDAGGQIDFMIIGSSPMDNPAMFFGNPHPSARVLKKGDFINNELAFGYRGYTAQIGNPICIGKPTDEIQQLWDNITLPIFQKLEAIMKPGTSYQDFQKVGQWVREQGYQSRPTVLHSIDYVTSNPYVWIEGTAVHEGETHFEPNMTVMLEPNPITPDGNLGLFLGRTYIITETGNEAVTKYPLELVVV